MTKVFIDTRDTVGRARGTLLNFYDELPMGKDYWGVTKGNFKELFVRSKGKLFKSKKRRPVAFNNNFRSLGAPPTEPPSLAPARQSDAGETGMSEEEDESVFE